MQKHHNQRFENYYIYYVIDYLQITYKLINSQCYTCIVCSSLTDEKRIFIYLLPMNDKDTLNLVSCYC